jgi:hypothetical protein
LIQYVINIKNIVNILWLIKSFHFVFVYFNLNYNDRQCMSTYRNGSIGLFLRCNSPLLGWNHSKCRCQLKPPRPPRFPGLERNSNVSWVTAGILGIATFVLFSATRASSGSNHPDCEKNYSRLLITFSLWYMYNNLIIN